MKDTLWSRMGTRTEWDDLIVPSEIRERLLELSKGVASTRSPKPGYRTLFSGPSGTGKTMAAGLLGKRLKRAVYRVDLSQLTSKYIGETEKNLSAVFDRAERRDAILFFDEADALFGKRTEVSDADDRYANQEVSYLMQRMESFRGIVIVATNLRSSLEKRLLRGFDMVIDFPLQDAASRSRIWEKQLSERKVTVDKKAIAKVAREYALSGGDIKEIVRRLRRSQLRRNLKTLSANDVVATIERYRRRKRKATA